VNATSVIHTSVSEPSCVIRLLSGVGVPAERGEHEALLGGGVRE
jgi:hypothetical protein